MGESDGSSVVCDDIGDTLRTHGSSLDSAELEFGLGGGDFGKSESSFAVIEESIIGLGFEECNNIHESNWEFVIFSYFSVDSDVSVLSEDNHLGFSCGEGEFQFISQ